MRFAFYEADFLGGGAGGGGVIAVPLIDVDGLWEREKRKRRGVESRIVLSRVGEARGGGEGREERTQEGRGLSKNE